MDEKSLKHGAFSWFELMTTDVDSAKKFYTELFNWGLKEMPMENMNYTVASVDGEDVAGLMPMPPGTQEMPPSWSLYITVDDVDVTAAKAKEIGKEEGSQEEGSGSLYSRRQALSKGGT